MSFGLWIVSYFVIFKVQAAAGKLLSVVTTLLHELSTPAPQHLALMGRDPMYGSTR